MKPQCVEPVSVDFLGTFYLIVLLGNNNIPNLRSCKYTKFLQVYRVLHINGLYEHIMKLFGTFKMLVKNLSLSFY